MKHVLVCRARAERSAKPHHFEYINVVLVLQNQVDHKSLVVVAEQELPESALRVVVVVGMAVPGNEFEHAEYWSEVLQCVVW